MWRHLYYILDDAGEPVPCDDPLAWGAWFETTDNRILARDHDEGAGPQGADISTVFLGLDHNDAIYGPPLLWETMVFGGPLNGEMQRYATREAALAGHQAMCQRVKDARDA